MVAKPVGGLIISLNGKGEGGFVGVGLLRKRFGVEPRLTWGMRGDTVDGRNPAPPRMIIIPLFIGL